MSYRRLLENNRRWASDRMASDPMYFRRVAREHRPHTLFIGCSDARVPADLITQAGPGELFVHRNIANQALDDDTNCLSAVQYAVEALRVEEIVICGHEGCGGVRAALSQEAPPLVGRWVTGVRAVARQHEDELNAIADEERRVSRLVELNVAAQVLNISRMPIVQRAWADGAPLRIHGCVYDLPNGLLRDLAMTVAPPASRQERRAG
jgi:carbonic anhydrase